METPEELARRLETKTSLPHGGGERFRGYGVMALPFQSGHVLALRRFTASSIGPAHTCLWHRLPDGRWTFYVDVDPALACPRYFGRCIAGARVDEITLRWTGPHAFTVSAREAGLDWTVGLAPSVGTRILNGVGRLVPPSLWNHDGTLDALADAAEGLLGTGPVSLTGRAPNGQRFRMIPRRVWTVDASAAVLFRRDLGPAGTARQSPTLGEVRLSRRGVFAFGDVRYEARPPARAVAVVL